MKIIHISTDDYSGGASIAAFRLHTAMLLCGIDSSLLVDRKTRIHDENVYVFRSTIFHRLKIRILNKIRGNPVKYNTLKGLFSYPNTGNNISQHLLVRQADIIYLHWINRDFLSISNIEEILKLKKPVFWVLHDMWAMTGGCHHSFECDKYTTHCFCCPYLHKPSAKDWSYRLFENKIKKFDRFNNLQIITPSKWLGECAKKSRLFSKKKIQVIPNLLDITLYKPADRKFARSIFNLPQDKKIVMFGAIEGTLNPYKGWSYMQEALKILAQNGCNIVVFIFGSDYSKTLVNSIPFPVYFSGHLHDDQSICMLYNAVDVFVACSLADNFPNTVVESLACGTPVVGFNIGGIPDLINHKENGYLAHYKDSDDLVKGILWTLDNNDKLRVAARNKIENIMGRALKNILTTIT